MNKTKNDYIKELVFIAFKIDDKANLMHEKTGHLQRMAKHAKQNLKDTHEFKMLESKVNHPTVTDFGNEISDLQSVVKKLKKYKWD